MKIFIFDYIYTMYCIVDINKMFNKYESKIISEKFYIV